MAAFFSVLHSLRASSTRLGVIAEAVYRARRSDGYHSTHRRWIKECELRLRISCARFRGCAALLTRDPANQGPSTSALTRPLQNVQDEINKVDRILDGLQQWTVEKVQLWEKLTASGEPPSQPLETDIVDLLRDFVREVHDERSLDKCLDALHKYVSWYEYQITGTPLYRSPHVGISSDQNQRWERMSKKLVLAYQGQQTFALDPPSDLESEYSFLRYQIRTAEDKICGDSSQTTFSLAACKFEPSTRLSRQVAIGKFWPSAGLNSKRGGHTRLTDDMRSTFVEIEQLDKKLQFDWRVETYDRRIEAAFFIVLTLTVTRNDPIVLESLDTRHIKNPCSDSRIYWNIPISITRREQHSPIARERRLLALGIALAELALAKAIDIAEPSAGSNGDGQEPEFTLHVEDGPSRVQVHELLSMVQRETSRPYSDAVKHCLVSSDGAISIHRFVAGVFTPLLCHYRALRNTRRAALKTLRDTAQESADLPRALQKRSSSQISTRSSTSILTACTPHGDHTPR